MSNLEKYTKAFAESFNVNQEDVVKFKCQDVPAWDSVAHMGLMTAIEETFGIVIESEDIINFTSFEEGKKILSAKYDIIF